MKVAKGDKVLFSKFKDPGSETLNTNCVGIVQCFPSPTMVDMLCKGDDYRTTIDNIKKVYGNVFD